MAREALYVERRWLHTQQLCVLWKTALKLRSEPYYHYYYEPYYHYYYESYYHYYYVPYYHRYIGPLYLIEAKECVSLVIIGPLYLLSQKFQ